MERDIADELIDFFANADVKNDTLALALLEPLKIQTPKPVKSEASTQTETQTEQLTPNTQLKENEEKLNNSLDPGKAIIEELCSFGLDTELCLSLEKSFEDIRKNLTMKDVETLEKPTGDKAFVRDHNLLPKLIVHPQMTLGKILKVYPHLPCPENFNKSAKVNIILGEWLPFLSKYSREYQVNPKIRDLTLNIIKLLVKPNPKKKRKSKKDPNNTVHPLEIHENDSSKN